MRNVTGSFGSAYQVKALANWLTSRAVSGKTPGQWTATFGVPAPAGGGTLNWTVIQTPPRYPRQVTKTITMPVAIGPTAPGALGFGTQPFGTSPFGGVTSLVPEIDLTFGIGLIGTNARAILSGQGQITIRGIEWHLKQKPLRRPQVYV